MSNLLNTLLGSVLNPASLLSLFGSAMQLPEMQTLIERAELGLEPAAKLDQHRHEPPRRWRAGREHN